MNPTQWLSLTNNLPEAYFLLDERGHSLEKNMVATKLLEQFSSGDIFSLLDIKGEQVNNLLQNIRQRKHIHTHFITRNKHCFQCFGSIFPQEEGQDPRFIVRLINEGRLSNLAADPNEKSLQYAKALEALSSITAPLYGDEFLKVFVKYFAQTLDAKFGLVSKLNQPLDGKVHTLAFWQVSDNGENFEYALKDTPCDEVYKNNIVYYDDKLQELFPKDIDLVNMGVSSYLGIPLIDSTNNAIGHICVLDDKPIDNNAFVQPILRIFAARVTAELERKSYQDKLLRSQEELEQRVISRTKELEEKNHLLDKRAQEAKAATESKSKFLANMSHDIRTPLNGVMGMLDILNTTPLSTEQKYYVETSIKSADSLLHLLNDILDLSRIESGKIELEYEQCEVTDILEDAISLMSPVALEKGLSINCDIGDILNISAHIDPHRIKQILINLISNAIKFTNTGEIRVAATKHGSNDDSKRLSITVQDSGIGIPEKHVHSIYAPFTQVDSPDKIQRQGSGLGLSICYELISLMGGTIEHNTPANGIGSIFTLTLPLLKYKKIDTIKVPVTANILLIEKEKNRSNIENLLRRKEIPATLVNNIHNISTAMSNTQDNIVIISDLPDPNSLDEIITNIQDLADLKTTQSKVIILSNGSNTPYKQQNIVSTVLQKPVHSKDLFKAIYKIQNTNSADKEENNNVTSHKTLEHHDLHVLVAEDNLVNQVVIGKMLKKIGVAAEIVENGEQAIQRLTEKSYDLIIMDCQMPVMDGYEATRAIRQLNHKNANIPIIALTANNMHGDREKSLHSGMDDHLAKPVTIKSISEMIALWKNKTHKKAIG